MSDDVGNPAADLLRVLSNELHPLQEKLLKAQIRKESAEAAVVELELASKQDAERDRLVKTGRIRHLYVNGTIGGPTQDKWMDALRHWGDRDPGEPVTIDINSPGGSVTDGLALYDMIMRLRERGTHVTTRAVGMAASMGAVVLQAGTDRVCDQHAKILIHEGATIFAGNTQLSRAEQEDMRLFQDMLLADVLDIISARATISKRTITNRWKRKDWWLSANEAMKLGFVDRIG